MQLPRSFIPPLSQMTRPYSGNLALQILYSQALTRRSSRFNGWRGRASAVAELSGSIWRCTLSRCSSQRCRRPRHQMRDCFSRSPHERTDQEVHQAIDLSDHAVGHLLVSLSVCLPRLVQIQHCNSFPYYSVDYLQKNNVLLEQECIVILSD